MVDDFAFLVEQVGEVGENPTSVRFEARFGTVDFQTHVNFPQFLVFADAVERDLDAAPFLAGTFCFS